MEQQKENTMVEVDLRKWVLCALRHWYWFVIGVVLCCGLGVVYLLRTNPKMTTSASMQIRDAKQGLSLGGASSALSLLGISGGTEVDDEILILQSRDLMAQVLNDLDLWTEYRVKDEGKWVGEFPRHTFTVEVLKWEKKVGSCRVNITLRKDGKYKVVVKRGRWHRTSVVLDDLTEPIETCAGTLKITQNYPATEEHTQFRAVCCQHLSVVDSYRTKVQIALNDKGSRMVNLTMTSDMPGRDVALISKLIEQYNLCAQMDRNLLASNTVAFVDERIQKVTQELSEAEDAMADYKKANNIADLRTEAKLALEANGEEQKQIASVRVQLDMVDYIEAFVKDETKKYSLIPANIGAADGTSVIDPSLASFISEYNNMLLRRMRILRTATENNPVVEQLNAQLEVMRQNIIAGVASARESLNIALKGLEQSDSKFATRMKSVPTQEQEYVRIMRQQQIKEQMYLYLYQKREENAFLLATSQLSARMVDTPKIDTDSRQPKTKNILFVCFVLGLCIPAMLLFVLDFFDGKVSSLREFKQMVKVPFVGKIAKGKKSVTDTDWKEGMEGELFRQLRTELLFRLPADKSHAVLAVTSCIEGEGKTYISWRIAQSLAMLNRKTVWVEMNLRRPATLTDPAMKAKGQLSAYLAGRTTHIDDLIEPTGQENLDRIACGELPANPAELLQTEAAARLFEELRKRYDYIVVDTAAVAKVGDALLLDKEADLTLMVCRVDYTPLELVEYINETAEKQRLHNMVCVLNGVEVSKNDYMY